MSHLAQTMTCFYFTVAEILKQQRRVPSSFYTFVLKVTGSRSPLGKTMVMYNYIPQPSLNFVHFKVTEI